MKKSSRIIALVLLLSMLSLLTISCGDKNTDNSSTEGDTTSSDENNIGNISSTENPRFAIKEDLPDYLDFEGRDFKILYPTWSMYSDYYFADTEIGEQLNDSIYKRTIDVEEKLNIKMVPVTKGGIDTVYPEASKTIKAGLDEYSLVLTHCITGVSSFITDGTGSNWNDVPYVDFSKPWWNQRMNDLLSIEGALIPAVSDFIIFDPNVIYFNKRMIQDYNLDDPYELVKSGKWTWTKLNEMAKGISQDLNGDGQFDKDDQYGFVTHVSWMLDSALQACDMFIVKKDETGYPQVNLMNEKFGNIAQTLYSILYENNTTFIGSWDPNYSTGTYESAVPMSTDRVLFHVDPLSVGKRYRTYDVEFGILPFPKYDEFQQEYLSLSWNGFMTVPSTADFEMVGAVSEMLAAESHRYVVPAYYDVLLTSKVSRDEESIEMIDIIYNGACYDFGLNLGSWNALSFPLSNLLGGKTAEYVSFLEKQIIPFEKSIEKLYNKALQNYVD